MPADYDKFVQRLAASGLMPAEALQSLVAQLPDTSRPTQGDDLARWLVKRGILTAYQAKEIYRGRTKRLVLGNYVILDRIGAGGMGQVFKAEHRRMKRTVALKLLPDEVADDAQLIARFQREVQAAAKLMHPNIVTAFDADEADGAFFLVMEHVPGKDLASVVKSQGPLSVTQAVQCVLDAARGLEYAHRNGVIHRDIKPANLLWSAGGVKILDMGLARIEDTAADVATQAELTGTGMVMGTVDYMAPEQALNTKNADARSDIYSLGVTIYYLLTGKPPYTGDSIMERLLRHREAPVPSLCAARPAIPHRLDDLFAKMVAKRPEDRYQSMSEIVQVLESLHADAPNSTMSAVSIPESMTSVDSALEKFLSRTSDENGSAPQTAVAPTRVAAEKRDEIAETFISQPDESTATAIGRRSRTLKPSRPSQPRLQRVGRQKRIRISRNWLQLGGGLIGLLLLAGVVITIRAPDGTETQVEVPHGVKASIDEQGNVKVVLPPERRSSTEAIEPPALTSHDSVSPATAAATVTRTEPVFFGPHGLKLSAFGGLVELPELEFDFSQPFTAEFWVDLDEGFESTVQQSNLLTVCSTIYFKFYRPTRQFVAGARGPVPGTYWESLFPLDDLPRGPFHTSVQWDGARVTLTVNGKHGRQFQKGVESPKMDEFTQHLREKLRSSSSVYMGSRAKMNEDSFSGEILAFRLSRGVRYPNDLAPGRLENDETTEVLYDFHEGSGDVLHDVSGHGHDGTIVGAEWVTVTRSDRSPEIEPHSEGMPAAQNEAESTQGAERAAAIPPAGRMATDPALFGPHGLRFSETGAEVRVPDLGINFSEPFTAECWVDLDERAELGRKHLYLMTMSSYLRLKIYSPVHTLVAGVATGHPPSILESVVHLDTLPAGPFHVVFQWDGEHVRLLVNGTRGFKWTTGDFAQPSADNARLLRDALRTSVPHLLIGSAVGADKAPFPGTIYAFRLSRERRYTEEFTPGRLVSDETTEVLYDFHEGSGGVLHDISGHGHDGTISGAEWVTVDKVDPSSTDAATDGQSTDLLAAVDPQRDALEFDGTSWNPGGWTREADGWICTKEGRVLLRCRTPVPPRSYSLMIDADPLDGKAGMWVVFPVASAQCFFAYNGFHNRTPGSAVSGFGHIDGKTEDDNETSKTHPLVPAGEPFRLQIDVEVRGEEVTLVASDRHGEVTRYEGPISRLAINETFLNFYDGKLATFGVGTTDAPMRMRSMTLHN